MSEEICMLTGIKVDVEPSRFPEVSQYVLKLLDKEVWIYICDTCRADFKQLPQHIIRGLILNDRWPKSSFLVGESCLKITVQNIERLVVDTLLQSFTYPKTPSEKLTSFFLFLFAMQSKDGQSIEVKFSDPAIWMKNYFVDPDECYFYVQGLMDNNLIHYEDEGMGDISGTLQITLKGLNYAAELNNEGANSKKCFIAMAFDENMRPYREAIRKAILKTGFELIIIDEEHIKSDKTIPDAILAGIKQSKFCISDFSLHRNGVYFESGYALGLGRPVIYTCREDEFEKSHFDIKQLQHIIYKTPEELEGRLVDKIEAWIK
jgi:hypothetical protein